MRKALIALFVLLVTLAVAATGALYYVGNEAEARFTATLDDLSAPPTVVVKKVSYERKLFGAEAETSLEIAAGPQTISIPFKHTISYAPFASSGMAEVNTEMVVPPAFKAEVDKIYGGASPLTGTTVIQFDGAQTTTFQSPAFTLKQPAATTSWQGISGTVSMQGGHLLVNAAAPGLKMLTPAANVTVQNIALNGDVTQGADEMWLGSSGFQVGKLEVTTPLTPPIAAEGLRIATESAESSPGLLRSSIAMDLKRLSVEELTFSNMGYALEAGNLDRATLAKLSKAMEKLQPTGGEASLEVLGTMMSSLPPLLKRSPTLTLKRLGAVTPWGDFKAEAKAVFDGKGELPTQPIMWLTKISVDGKVDVSSNLLRWVIEQQVKERAKKIAQMGKTPMDQAQTDALTASMTSVRLTRLQQTGAIMPNGDRYTVTLHMADGAFTVNGKDVQEMAALMD